MVSEAILRIKVITDASQAAAGLDKAEAVGGKFGSAMRKAALPAAAAGAAILALGKKSLDAASDLQQSQGAVEAVFGNQAKAVQKSADSAAKTMGLSAASYNQYAALIGTAMQNAGFSVEDSVTESNKAMQRAADLSALYGGSTADAVDAINAAVSRSEFDPLEKYGVSLNMTAVNAELAAKGQDKLTGAALATAKKQIILAQIYDQSSKAAGQYAREADSVAGSQQTASAEFTNAAAALGQVLLPIVAKFTAKLAELAKWAQQNTTTVQILAGVILGLSVAVLAVNAALKVAAAVQLVWNAAMSVGNTLALGTRIGLAALAVQEFVLAAATKVAAAAMWLFNTAMSAGVIGLVVIAVIALVAAIILLWKKSSAFRAFVLAMWKAIKVAATAAWTGIKAVGSAAFAALSAYVRAYLAVARAVFNGVRIAIGAVVSAVSSLIGWLKRIKVPSFSSAFNTAKAAAGHVIDAVQSLIGWLGRIKTPGVFSSAFDTAKAAIDRVISAVRSLIGWLGRIKVPKISLPKNPFSRSVAPSATAPGVATMSPTVRGLTASPVALASSSTGGNGGGVTVIVNGALDPDAVARQIRRILSGHATRVGLSTGAAL